MEVVAMTRPFGLLFQDDFDNLWETLTKGGGVNYINSNFPPANVLIDEDKNLYFYFALAGYNKEDIAISFSGDYMILKITPPEKNLKEGVKYLHKGIKNASCTSRYYVPNQRYDTDNVNASFKDGILKVEVSSKAPEKARLIKIE